MELKMPSIDDMFLNYLNKAEDGFVKQPQLIQAWEDALKSLKAIITKYHQDNQSFDSLDQFTSFCTSRDQYKRVQYNADSQWRDLYDNYMRLNQIMEKSNHKHPESKIILSQNLALRFEQLLPAVKTLSPQYQNLMQEHTKILKRADEVNDNEIRNSWRPS
jgi:hypothetical protein